MSELLLKGNDVTKGAKEAEPTMREAKPVTRSGKDSNSVLVLEWHSEKYGL